MENNDQEIRRILKAAFPPLKTQPRRDLWPDVLRRLDQHAITAPWYDWVMLALLMFMLVVFPGFIPVLLYHL
jgi:hypothetical protein